MNDVLQLTCDLIARPSVTPDDAGCQRLIAHRLQRAGYTIIPVNPAYQEVMGLKCYPDLHAVPEKIDIVDVFRKPAEVMPVVDEAIAVGAGCVWLQLGVIAPEAAHKAAEAGLKVVVDRCTKIDYLSLVAG